MNSTSSLWLNLSLPLLQVLPPEALQTETGELTDLGRSYVPPRNLLEALSVICSVAGQWNDPAEAEKLALDIIIVTHHPSIGLIHTIFVACHVLLLVADE